MWRILMPKKLKLNNLTVQSFVTQLGDEEKEKLHGGRISGYQIVCMSDTPVSCTQCADCGGGTGGTGGATRNLSLCYFTCGGFICDDSILPDQYC